MVAPSSRQLNRRYCRLGIIICGTTASSVLLLLLQLKYHTLSQRWIVVKENHSLIHYQLAAVHHVPGITPLSSQPQTSENTKQIFDWNNDQVPGLFANQSLYLQGIRLSTHYDRSVHDVHLDLFGFPGDPFQTKQHPYFCRSKKLLRRNLWRWEYIMNNVTLFCQMGNHIHPMTTNNKMMTPMTLIPSAMSDKNSKNIILVWRGNLTHILNRTQLLDQIQRHIMNPNGNSSLLSSLFVPVHIWMMHPRPPPHHDKNDYHNHTNIITRLASFQIPLDTGVVGAVGSIVRGGPSANPTIRSDTDDEKGGGGGGNVVRSYFQQPAVPAGLCVATFRPKSLPFLRQFVQHHLNVGFGSIVIGVGGTKNSAEMKQAQLLLQPYIDHGVVTLANYGIDSGQCPFDCNKLQFYTTCLFHHKGLTKYSAAWDIDEFWTPPPQANQQLFHEKHKHSNSSSSSWSTFPRLVREDPIWQKSPYATSKSFGDVMMEVDQYYKQHGCLDRWCYHELPSRIVFLRNNWTEMQSTTNIRHNFYQREKKYDAMRIKSVSNTKYAHLGDFHKAGACYYDRLLNASLSYHDQHRLFSSLAVYRHMRPCRLKKLSDPESFGSVHHFWNLLSGRQVYGVPGPIDEYVSIFAPTVELQLERYQNVSNG